MDGSPESGTHPELRTTQPPGRGTEGCRSVAPRAFSAGRQQLLGTGRRGRTQLLAARRDRGRHAPPRGSSPPSPPAHRPVLFVTGSGEEQPQEQGQPHAAARRRRPLAPGAGAAAHIPDAARRRVEWPPRRRGADGGHRPAARPAPTAGGVGGGRAASGVDASRAMEGADGPPRCPR